MTTNSRTLLPADLGASTLARWISAIERADRAGAAMVLLAASDPADPIDGLAMAAWCASRTRSIRLCASLDPATVDPFTLARGLATLDHLSGGRAAWRLTGPADEARTAELADVVARLLVSWGADALLTNRDQGLMSDQAAVAAIGHAGAFFTVRGPLNIPRPPQGVLPRVALAGDPAATDADLRFSDDQLLHATIDQATASKPLALGLFLLGHGHNVGAWRSSDTPAADLLGLDYYRGLAAAAERGRLDMIFFAEILYSYELAGRHQGALAFPTLDPFVLIPALSGATERIGFVGTYSTSYTDPRATALKLATIDRLNGGRTGWNIVTTGADQSAGNFGRNDLPEREARYARATDYVAQARDLWRRWPGTPQGEPVRVQAGMSPFGKAFAASVAEVMFTVARTVDAAIAFRSELRDLVGQAGRDPDHVRVMPGIAPILGGTEAEARANEQRYAELLHPRIQLAMLGDQFGIDFSGYALDAPLPMDDIRQAPKVLSGARDPDRLIDTSAGIPTLGDYLRSQARVRAHHSFVGTPEQLAAQMGDWHDRGACDGFNLMFPVQAEGVPAFVDHVVPLLRRQGRVRSDYEGSTLRSHLGLPAPAGAER